MMNGIEYIDYDKISDDLCWLGNKCVVRMVVKLARKGKDNERNHFHREYKYSTPYVDKREAITIRRSFSYYISIDPLEYSNSSIMITINDILLLRQKLAEAFNWLYDNTFAYKKSKLIILNKRQPAIVDGLVGGKMMKFEPIIYEDMEGKQEAGVRITLNDNNIFTDVPMSILTGFMYLMNSVDMFTAAQNMINYIGHPDFGTNLLRFEESKYVSGNVKPSDVVKERKINTKQKVSFFDLEKE